MKAQLTIAFWQWKDDIHGNGGYHKSYEEKEFLISDSEFEDVTMPFKTSKSTTLLFFTKNDSSIGNSANISNLFFLHN